MLLLTTRAHAEEPNASAEELFREGNALVAAGRFAEACPKLAESQRLDPAVGTQFNLADCYEHLDKTATAFALFNEVAHIARSAGKFERERLAKERADKLEPKLARLTLHVAAPAPGLELRIDDALVARDRWEHPTPIDPGAHHVVVSAPSRTAWKSDFTATAAKTVEIKIPELVDPTPKPRPVIVTTKAPASTQKTVAIGVAGVGVAGILAGSVAGAISIAARSSAEDACPEATYHFRCPTQRGVDDWSSATTAGDVSTVGFIVGGAALAAAAVLWLTAPKARGHVGNIGGVWF